jgi:hypothetical protein
MCFLSSFLSLLFSKIEEMFDDKFIRKCAVDVLWSAAMMTDHVMVYYFHSCYLCLVFTQAEHASGLHGGRDGWVQCKWPNYSRVLVTPFFWAQSFFTDTHLPTHTHPHTHPHTPTHTHVYMYTYIE